MGRFFPKANKEEIILNFKEQASTSYNEYFVYPTGGAIEYINSLYKNVDDTKVSLNEKVIKIDIHNKIAYTNKREIKYDNLISTIPFPLLLELCDISYTKEYFTWNKVLVFNLGFNKKGSDTESSWVYIPDKEICFYRMGYYDNILGTSKMSLYIEMGFPNSFIIEDEQKYLHKVLKDLKKIGVVKDEELIEKLVSLVLKNNSPDRKYVGKDAKYILKQLGIEVGDEIRVIIVETDKNHPFAVEELLMPILPIVKVKDALEGIKVAKELEKGLRHTAVIHSKNIDILSKYAREMETTILVKNGPSYAGIGIGGEGHVTFTIAGPTGEGLTSARSFARNRRCVLVGGFSIK